MKTKLIISTLLLISALSAGAAFAAKDKGIASATHMWILTGDALVHVYVGSVQQCEMFARQASLTNSSQANCFNASELVKSISCRKSTQSNGEPNCS